MKYLDTTTEIIKYDKTLKSYYDYYFFKLRKKYLKFIDKNFYDKINLDILVSSVAEKNIPNSYIYHNLCLYFSIIKILKKRKLEKIFVNNSFLKNQIEKKYKVEIVIKKNQYKIKSIYNFIKVATKHISIYLLVNIFYSKKSRLNQITIVDRFVTDKNPNVDRYYNNFYREKKNIYQIPTFVNLSLFQIFIFLLKIKKKNFIMKSAFLNISDIIFSLMYFFRLKKIFFKKIYFEKLNISELVNNELKQSNNYNASVIGIKNFLFAKKLKLRNISVAKVVDWYENTTVDKGWNYGFRKFYPNIKTYGYQNYFVEKKFSALDITPLENKSKSCPEFLLLISKSVKQARKEFTNKLKFIHFKALRFDYLFKLKFYKLKFNDRILILLNLNIYDNLNIINKILETNFSKNGNKIFVKEHPLLKLKDYYKEKLPDNWVITNGHFVDIIKKYKIVVTSGSSSSVFESILLGGKVLFPLNNYYDALNLKFLGIPKKLYKVCSNIKDLDNSINKILNQNINKFMYYNNKKRIRKIINYKNINLNSL
jgi:hypothetical protein